MGIALKHISGIHAVVEKASAVLDSIKINSIAQQHRDDGNWFVKHRNVVGRVIAKMANFYFAIAHVPIRYWCRREDWQRWEVDCFRMLNDDRFEAQPVGSDTVRTSGIPGKSLWIHLTRRTITRKIVQAAGAELRRAHRMWSDEFHGLWSHGDASMSNFIYDEKAHRVRLIDFELIHDKSLSASERHADDLLVFLLDLVGFVSQRSWLPLALSFLRTYNRPEVMVELRKRLEVPRGLARIWWNVRSNSVSCLRIRRRFAELDRALAV